MEITFSNFGAAFYGHPRDAALREELYCMTYIQADSFIRSNIDTKKRDKIKEIILEIDLVTGKHDDDPIHTDPAYKNFKKMNMPFNDYYNDDWSGYYNNDRCVYIYFKIIELKMIELTSK